MALLSDEIKAKRTPVRAQLTRVLNTCDNLLRADPVDIDNLIGVFEVASGYFQSLENWDLKMIEALENEGEPEEIINAEYERQDEYKFRFCGIKAKVNRVQNPPLLPPPVFVERPASPGAVSEVNRSHRRLPTVKIPVFSGELKDWIGWWAQFKPIHLDDDIDTAVKFTYLRQAIQQGTRAWELVSSYPPSAENYPKVIQSLTERFGDEDLLIEVYVRELISLMNESSRTENWKQKEMNLVQLFDRIESHLRALETLGVKQTESHFLFPMIESCLPVPVLRAWQRSSFKKDKAIKNKLERLMLFLKDEVEGETRILLAHQKPVNENQKEKKTPASPKQERRTKSSKTKNEGDLPTAMGLVSLDAKKGCGFCFRQHRTEQCRTAWNWSIEDRKKKLTESWSCFNCLQRGHRARDCREVPVCGFCGGKHPEVLCYNPNQSQGNQSQAQALLPPQPLLRPQSVLPPQPVQQPQLLPPQQQSTRQPTSSKRNGATDDPVLGLSNYSCGSDVLYPTLTVGIIGTQGNMKKVRAAIDSLSGHSYIREEVARDLMLRSTGQISINHALFSGIMKKKQHQKYRFILHSLCSSFNLEIEAFGTDTISSGVPGSADREVVQEMRNLGIQLSDKNKSGEIDVLIGGNIAGKLLTGTVYQLQAGPTAIETRLGWTVMGEVHSQIHSNEDQEITTYSCGNMTSAANLWELETLGIRDPSEKVQKEVLDEQALQHFRDTV